MNTLKEAVEKEIEELIARVKTDPRSHEKGPTHYRLIEECLDSISHKAFKRLEKAHNTPLDYAVHILSEAIIQAAAKLADEIGYCEKCTHFKTCDKEGIKIRKKLIEEGILLEEAKETTVQKAS